MFSDIDAQVYREHALEKNRALELFVKSFQSALVAFSGGVDSALMLKVAHGILGKSCIALTAVSASVPHEEVDFAKEFCAELGVEHRIIESKETENRDYQKNASNRCYFCKTELYSIADTVRRDAGFEMVFDGYNADDKKDHRPGHAAALEKRVASPLAHSGFTKNEVRALSHHLGLKTWNKPQLACLASRIPYGTEVTVARLHQIGQAERNLRKLGFHVFRVRHHAEVARVELSADEWDRVRDSQMRHLLNEAVKSAGFTYVSVDLEPFRSGRLNDSLSNTR